MIAKDKSILFSTWIYSIVFPLQHEKRKLVSLCIRIIQNEYRDSRPTLNIGFFSISMKTEWISNSFGLKFYTIIQRKRHLHLQHFNKPIFLNNKSLAFSYNVNDYLDIAEVV